MNTWAVFKFGGYAPGDGRVGRENTRCRGKDGEVPRARDFEGRDPVGGTRTQRGTGGNQPERNGHKVGVGAGGRVVSGFAPHPKTGGQRHLEQRMAALVDAQGSSVNVL